MCDRCKYWYLAAYVDTNGSFQIQLHNGQLVPSLVIRSRFKEPLELIGKMFPGFQRPVAILVRNRYRYYQIKLSRLDELVRILREIVGGLIVKREWAEAFLRYCEFREKWKYSRTRPKFAELQLLQDVMRAQHAIGRSVKGLAQIVEVVT